MSALAQPILIFLFGIGGGFMIPLLYKVGYSWLHAGFAVALGGLTLASVFSLLAVIQSGGVPIEVLTAGATPPLSINLRFGLAEGAFAVSVNLMAILLAASFWDQLRRNYVALLLFLILVMGINGMILTRDLFNLFVFLEIVSIGTYGLLGLLTSRAGIQAAFKYVIATVVASTLFLLGSVLVYQVTGHLNIDLLIGERDGLTGPVGVIAVTLVLACLLIELKPFPANGWGLDVYETAPPALAAFLSVCASAGMLFAVYKLLPLFSGHLDLIIASSALTFLASNLIGLRQTKVQRMLGYSSVGQMALALLALAVLTRIGASDAIPLVVFGLFVNHLLAKAGLFCLAGAIGATDLREALGLTRRPMLAGGMALFVLAIGALPPFPGFWAKWELILQLAGAGHHMLIALLLAGSLMEAVYIFRWFIRAIAPADDRDLPRPVARQVLPLWVMALSLGAAGVGMAVASGAGDLTLFLPLIAGGALLVVERLVPDRVGGLAMLVVVAAGWLVMPAAEGIAHLFAGLLLAGGLVIASAGLTQTVARPLHYPLVAVLLLSIQSLLRAETGLAFYVAWEFITLASFFLVGQGRNALPEVLRFLLFSLFAAFLIIAGLAQIAAQTGSRELAALAMAGPSALAGFVLLAAGFLVKAAAVGVHVWLPSAYAEAPDDVTALLSAVVSKVAVFGLLMVAYAAGRSGLDADLAYPLAWIGMATTVAGALLALCQTDLKRLLAFSSMSQLGYIVTAVALTNHLGWVTALYIVANHMLVKGILFLAAAAIILRTGARRLDELNGLGRAMPLTLAAVAMALLSMSGLPPLMGFGGKWLLLSAMMDKGWTALALAGTLATFLGLWYMLRLLAVLAAGPARAGGREAPAMILLPQALLIGGILVLSLFPKLLMGPVSDAIDPQFATTLVWEGQSLETIYGLWNPAPVMAWSVAGAFGIAVIWWGLARFAGPNAGLASVLMSARPLPARVMPAIAQAAWSGLARGTELASDGLRRIYTGNGQVNLLLVLVYFLVLYAGAILMQGT
jgi:formate hydrogenlyase subunit 3/multisubunit Na+/H+ antiporter MnhD subunit